MRQTFIQRFCRNRGAVVGLVVLLGVVAIALAGPLLTQHDPFAMVELPFLRPGEQAGFWMGTDTLGRDILAGVIYGSRIKYLVIRHHIVTAILEGYFGGWMDTVLMRFTEMFQAVPGVALAIVLVAIFQPSVYSMIAAIAIVSWPPVARLARSEFLALRQREFVQAALLAGESTPRIILTQILPNAASPIIVMASLMVATAILLESGLSFLGLGDPNYMTWGYMVGAARTVLVQAWWMALFPGLAILLTVLALNLVGEGLSDGLNARLGEGAR